MMSCCNKKSCKLLFEAGSTGATGFGATGATGASGTVTGATGATEPSGVAGPYNESLIFSVADGNQPSPVPVFPLSATISFPTVIVTTPGLLASSFTVQPGMGGNYEFKTELVWTYTLSALGQVSIYSSIRVNSLTMYIAVDQITNESNVNPLSGFFTQTSSTMFPLNPGDIITVNVSQLTLTGSIISLAITDGMWTGNRLQ